VLQRDTSSSIAQNMELRRKIVTKNTSRFVWDTRFVFDSSNFQKVNT
jgi:hypothetical protein